MPERQFSLRKLLLIVTGLSLICGAFAAGGLQVGAPLLLTAVLYVIWPRRNALTLTEALALGFGLFLIMAMFLPAISSPRVPSRRSQCNNNLKQLSLALLSYNDKYGTLPPAYLADAHGKPMHSWRVLLLPFMEEQQLYNQYRFDEPWDGPNNSKLAAQVPMLDLYHCPSDQTGTPQHTNYLAVVGPSTVWPGEVGRKISEISDGLGDTILLVEASQSGVHWMEPRDLDLSQMNLQLNAPTGQSPRSQHPGGIVVAFADGHTHFLSDSLTPEQLRALLTADGQEAIDFDY